MIQLQSRSFLRLRTHYSVSLLLRVDDSVLCKLFSRAHCTLFAYVDISRSPLFGHFSMVYCTRLTGIWIVRRFSGGIVCIVVLHTIYIAIAVDFPMLAGDSYLRNLALQVSPSWVDVCLAWSLKHDAHDIHFLSLSLSIQMSFRWYRHLRLSEHTFKLASSLPSPRAYLMCIYWEWLTDCAADASLIITIISTLLAIIMLVAHDNMYYKCEQQRHCSRCTSKCLIVWSSTERNHQSIYLFYLN